MRRALAIGRERLQQNVLESGGTGAPPPILLNTHLIKSRDTDRALCDDVLNSILQFLKRTATNKLHLLWNVSRAPAIIKQCTTMYDKTLTQPSSCINSYKVTLR